MNVLRTHTAHLLLLIFSLIFITIHLHAQTVLLPDRWCFTIGDSAAYSSPLFNDSAWSLMDVPAWWEDEGLPGYDGFAWYRVHFVVPHALLGQPLYLLLGKIDDVDEAFLNGQRVGGMGKFPPAPETAWDRLRIYRLPSGALHEENVLAVRVYDMMGAGGIGAGPIGLYDQRDYDREFNPPPGPKKSLTRLVTANGLISAVYNERRAMIEVVRPHVFQAYDSAQMVQPAFGSVKPTIDAAPARVGYRNNTHIISVGYPDLTIDYFAPFTTEEKILYAAVSGPAFRVRRCSFTWERRGARAVLVDSATFQRDGGRSEKYFLFGFTDSLHTDRSVVVRAKERLLAMKGGLLNKEERFMRDVIERAAIPGGIKPAERRVLEQSIAVLKMAQVPSREIFPKARGQILASLSPGVWNISWVRDGMYAVLGLNRLQLFPEARQMLEFCLAAESGHYVHYRYTDSLDHGVGVPYQISVCRYFGPGKEESDYNDRGPNIELDGFGLFLTAFSDYVRRSGDTAFFTSRYQQVARYVADAIVHNIDTNDLIRRESGPWERHMPGKQFAYTSITCAAGLRDFGDLLSRRGERGREQYRAAFERLLSGIRSVLVVEERLIKGNAEAKDSSAYDYFDAGTFEAFGLGLFGRSALFLSHYDAYERALRVAGERRGFSRINKGDAYEAAEWLLLDLRIASALEAFGEREKARDILDWVTDQATLNFGLIPELFAEKTAFYDGAIPMVGFGAGAYAVAMWDAYE